MTTPFSAPVLLDERGIPLAILVRRKYSLRRATEAKIKARSDGRCLFVMPKGKDFDAIRAKVAR